MIWRITRQQKLELAISNRFLKSQHVSLYCWTFSFRKCDKKQWHSMQSYQTNLNGFYSKKNKQRIKNVKWWWYCDVKYLKRWIETVHAEAFSFVAFKTPVVAFTRRRGTFLLFIRDWSDIILLAVASGRRSRSGPRTDADVARITRSIAGHHSAPCNNVSHCISLSLDGPVLSIHSSHDCWFVC